MKIGIFSNEYPPNVYGGAGVHVEYLTQELSKLDDGAHDIIIKCFGDQKIIEKNLNVEGINPDFPIQTQDKRHEKFMNTLLRDLMMAGAVDDIDVVHCHTWYSHLAGCLAKQLLSVPLVLSTHSLEPHRPWKAEQLGTAYKASTWIEKTAYQNADGVIAVSQSMRQDVHDLYDVPFEKIRVIYNGIDLDQYRPKPDDTVLERFGIKKDKPFILFVGRITRQKGIIHLVNAIRFLNPGVQIVLCAGAPDTEEIGKEMEEAVTQARAETENEVIWIAEMLPKDKVISLYSMASIFVCPSVYEPFGIINLEAMACETAVVASAVGGIKEVVIPEETGLLVSFEQRGQTDFEPKDPEQFSQGLANAVNRLMDSPDLLNTMGQNSRRRVEEVFSWKTIARQTLTFYEDLIQNK